MEQQPSAESERQAAHQQLVDEVVVIIGILTATTSPKRVVRFLSDGAHNTFRQEAFLADPETENDENELLIKWLDELEFEPGVKAVDFQDNFILLSELAEQHYNSVMSDFDRRPETYPHIQSILSTITEAELKSII